MCQPGCTWAAALLRCCTARCLLPLLNIICAAWCCCHLISCTCTWTSSATACPAALLHLCSLPHCSMLYPEAAIRGAVAQHLP
jgi:hypothetical protein